MPGRRSAQPFLPLTRDERGERESQDEHVQVRAGPFHWVLRELVGADERVVPSIYVLSLLGALQA